MVAVLLIRERSGGGVEVVITEGDDAVLPAVAVAIRRVRATMRTGADIVDALAAVGMEVIPA